MIKHATSFYILYYKSQQIENKGFSLSKETSNTKYPNKVPTTPY